MAKMIWSDTLQEEYRKPTAKERKATQEALIANWFQYTYFEGCEPESAFELVQEILASDEMTYAWGTRLGTIEMEY